MKRKMIILLSSLVLAAITTGCSKGQSANTPTPPVPPQAQSSVISATGVVVPLEWATLSFQSSGIVDVVLVKDGDQVSKGAPLIKMQGIEQAKAAAASAEMTYANTVAEAKKLNDNAGQIAAQALIDQGKAQDLINAASRELDRMQESAYKEAIKTAERDVNREKTQLDEAQKTFDKVASRPETDATRKYQLDRLNDQQRDYDEAVRKLTDLQNQKTKAEGDLALGKAMLETAIRTYEDNKNGLNTADAQLAESKVASAKANLEAAQSKLSQLELTAPFDGIVSSLRIRSGEWMNAGQPALQIASTGKLQIETTDLNEVDVARVSVGDTALVTFDALPDTTVDGKVIQIASKSSEGTGVNYTVTIELAQIPAKLRWGMTAFADINVK